MTEFESEMLIHARIQTELLLMMAVRMEPNCPEWRPAILRLEAAVDCYNNELLRGYRENG